MHIVPAYTVQTKLADDAYEAFAALRRVARSQPELLENEHFTALQDTAYARFLSAFEAIR